jgi:hypothetical protein
MDVKDFFYNLGKSLCISTILESKDYRSQLMSIIFGFIDYEYSTLHFSKQTMSTSVGKSGSDQVLLDRMTYANMVDSEEYKKYRRQAYSKLYCFLEML